MGSMHAVIFPKEPITQQQLDSQLMENSRLSFDGPNNHYLRISGPNLRRPTWCYAPKVIRCRDRTGKMATAIDLHSADGAVGWPYEVFTFFVERFKGCEVAERYEADATDEPENRMPWSWWLLGTEQELIGVNSKALSRV